MAPLDEIAEGFQRLSCQTRADRSEGLILAEAAACASATAYCGGTGAGGTSVNAASGTIGPTLPSEFGSGARLMTSKLAAPDPWRTDTVPSGAMSMTCADAGDAKRPAATPMAATLTRRARITERWAASRSENSDNNLRHPPG